MGDDDDFMTWLHAQMEAELDRLLSIALDFEIHQMMWGVPCGPTLTMLPGGQVLEGIRFE